MSYRYYATGQSGKVNLNVCNYAAPNVRNYIHFQITEHVSITDTGTKFYTFGWVNKKG